MSVEDLPDVLGRILAQRRRRLLADPQPPAPPAPTVSGENPFVHALERRRGNAIIAEIKLGSPRLGDLRGRFDPLRWAETYARAGAAALSVVVEPDFFFGSYQLLRDCQSASGLPAVAKDFVVDERQIEWAANAGASAVLLIAAVLEREALERYTDLARSHGLEPLIETHDQQDTAKLARADYRLVGVNNRDLRTFNVDLERSALLAAQLPAGALRIAESGIESRADLLRLRAAGFDAFLIGESLVLAADPAQKLAELLA